MPYTFTDEQPIANQMNYYRLELGSQGYSTPLAISFIPLNDDGYNLRLDPGGTAVNIFFSNPGKDISEAAVMRAMELSAESYCPAQAMLAKAFPMTLKYYLYEGETIESASLMMEGSLS